jgi:predicted ATPase
MFDRDPEIKLEVVWSGPVLRPSVLLSQRAGPAVMTRDGRRWADTGRRLERQDSLLAEVSDAVTAPEVLAVRNRVRSWRFYDSFRTDPEAPARGARMGTYTPVMADDGGDLASALQTLREIGPDLELDDAIGQAFPGSRLEIVDSGGLFRLGLRQTGLLRPLDAAELSDGTLRFLLWAAALLTPRPPELVRAQRAGDQPAPRPAGAAGRHGGRGGGPDAGRRRHALGSPAGTAGGCGGRARPP